MLRAFLIVVFSFVSQQAHAAPPSSCAAKFQGAWQITVSATGQTYRGEYLSNGEAVAHCPFCSKGTWTCSGDVITVHVNSIQVQHRLSADQMRLEGGCCIARRIGAPPARPAAAPPAARPPAANDPGAGDADAMQCVKVVKSTRSEDAWRIENRCPYGATVTYRAGGSTARNYISSRAADGVESRTEPQILSACARGSRNCR